MGTKRALILTVLLGVIVVSSGCAGLGTYFKDRALDFVDCFKADVGYGYGLDVRLRVTNYFAPSVGLGHTWNAGFRGRHAGTWRNVDLGFPFAGMILFWDNANNPWAFLCLGICNAYIVGVDNGDISKKEDTKMHPGGFMAASYLLLPGINFSAKQKSNRQIESDPYAEHIINRFDIEVGGTLGIVGFQVGFSPGQFADFLLGWFGVDIGDDDTASIAVKNHEEK